MPIKAAADFAIAAASVGVVLTVLDGQRRVVTCRISWMDAENIATRLTRAAAQSRALVDAKRTRLLPGLDREPKEAQEIPQSS
jgi:hypothetical protein